MADANRKRTRTASGREPQADANRKRTRTASGREPQADANRKRTRTASGREPQADANRKRTRTASGREPQADANRKRTRTASGREPQADANRKRTRTASGREPQADANRKRMRTASGCEPQADANRKRMRTASGSGTSAHPDGVSRLPRRWSMHRELPPCAVSRGSLRARPRLAAGGSSDIGVGRPRPRQSRSTQVHWTAPRPPLRRARFPRRQRPLRRRLAPGRLRGIVVRFHCTGLWHGLVLDGCLVLDGRRPHGCRHRGIVWLGRDDIGGCGVRSDILAQVPATALAGVVAGARLWRRLCRRLGSRRRLFVRSRSLYGGLFHRCWFFFHRRRVASRWGCLFAVGER